MADIIKISELSVVKVPEIWKNLNQVCICVHKINQRSVNVLHSHSRGVSLAISVGRKGVFQSLTTADIINISALHQLEKSQKC